MKITEIEKQLKQLQEEVEKLKKGKYEEGIVPISGKDYETIKINGLEWLREDLEFVPVSGFGDEVGVWEKCYRYWEKCYRYWEKCYRYYYSWTTANIVAKMIGDGWRLPTKDEFKALYKELGGDFQEVMKTKMNGHYIPDKGLSEQGSYGYWWSSTPGGVTYAYSLYFDSSTVYPSYGSNKCYGLTIRLVRKAK